MAVSPLDDGIGKQLCEALGLPNQTRAFELRVALDEPITVKCEFYPDLPDGKRGDLLTVIRRLEYRDTTSLEDASRHFQKNE